MPRQFLLTPGWRLMGLTLLCMPLWLSSCSPDEEQESEALGLARVGNEEITLAEFEAELKRRLAAGRPITDKDSVLQEMIRERVLEQQARAEGLDQDPDYQRQVRKLLIGRLREQELNSRLRDVKVSDDEIEEEYHRHLDEYSRPAKIRLAMLHLRTDPKMSEDKVAELRQQLEAARESLSETPPAEGRGVASTGFGSLAISNSEDQASRYRGGDIGWFDVGKFNYRWPKEVLSAGYALKEHGDFSEVIGTSSGLYVIMKVDSREKMITPLAEVAKGIKHRLILKKREDLEDDFEKRLEKEVSVEINHTALETVEVPGDTGTGAKTLIPPNFP